MELWILKVTALKPRKASQIPDPIVQVALANGSRTMCVRDQIQKTEVRCCPDPQPQVQGPRGTDGPPRTTLVDRSTAAGGYVRGVGSETAPTQARCVPAHTQCSLGPLKTGADARDPRHGAGQRCRSGVYRPAQQLVIGSTPGMSLVFGLRDGVDVLEILVGGCPTPPLSLVEMERFWDSGGVSF